jgi:hypothetical protein
VVAGAVMSLAGFVNAWGPDSAAAEWGIVFRLGLAAMGAGAGIIVWRTIAWGLRRGSLAAVLAGLGALASASLLAAVAYVSVARGEFGETIAMGSLISLVAVGLVMTRGRGGGKPASGRR